MSPQVPNFARARHAVEARLGSTLLRRMPFQPLGMPGLPGWCSRPDWRSLSSQGTASRIEGVGFEQLGADALALHAVAYHGHMWPQESPAAQELPNPGDYHFR